MALKNKTHDIERAAVERASNQSARSENEQQQVSLSGALEQIVTKPASALRPADIRTLQRAAGNRAVRRLLTGQARSTQAAEAPVGQPVQTKLTIGPAGDKYEQEADRVAEQVMTTPLVSHQARVQGVDEDEEIQEKPLAAGITPLVQRWEIPDDEETELRKKSLAPVEAGAEPEAVTPGVENAIEGTRGGGQSLPEGVRARMEQAFGADFGGVRVHTDAQSDQANRSIQARAFTTRQDIFFRQGEYDPTSHAGQQLIAHELTHVVQQNDNLVGPVTQSKRSVITTLPAVQTSIQAALDLNQFQAATTLGKNRKAIAAIDNAVETYNALVKPTQQQQEKALDDVLSAIDAYVKDKEQNDPTNARIAPVKRFRKDVENEKKAFKEATKQEFHDKIEGDPDSNSTETFVVDFMAGAPSLRDEVKFYFEQTKQEKKTSVIIKLSKAGKLADVLDDALIDGEVLTGIRGFHKGDQLTDDERKALDTVVMHSKTLATVKELFAIRFNLSEVEIKALPIDKPLAGEGKVKNAVDWDVPGLKRAYKAMTLLPKGHVADNPSLKKFQRFKGGGGWHGFDEEIAIGYENLEEVASDERTIGDKWNNRGLNIFIGKNYFDKTVRHEVGHAVDAKKKFSDAHCINNAAGGNWKTYGDGIYMVKDFMGLKNGALWKHPLFDDQAKVEVANLLKDNPDIAAVKRATIQYMRNLGQAAAGLLPANQINFADSLVNDDSVFVELAPSNLKKPWKTAESPAVAGRTFVYSNETTLSSYDASARTRQVSNYQFRAPQEWFAEAYAAYYEPDDTQQGYGSKLKEVDKPTYDYFVANVDKAI